MKLVELCYSELDSQGLPKYSWIIRDPENTRYTQHSHSPFAITFNGATVGFMTLKRNSRMTHIGYLVFDPQVGSHIISLFCKNVIQGPISITAYDQNFQEDLWRKMGFQFRPGHMWMEMDVNCENQTSTYSIKNSGARSRVLSREIRTRPAPKGPSFLGINSVEQLTWPAAASRIESLYQKCFPEDEWSYLDDFKNDSNASTATILISTADAKDVGFYVAIPIDTRICFICWLGVLPEYRGKGVSQHLFNAASGVAYDNSQAKMSLLVKPDNQQAINFYRKMQMKKKWQRIILVRD